MCIVLGYMQNYDGCYERVERGGVRGGEIGGGGMGQAI